MLVLGVPVPTALILVHSNIIQYPVTAGVYAVLGEKEEAMNYLEKAYDQKVDYLPQIATD